MAESDSAKVWASTSAVKVNFKSKAPFSPGFLRFASRFAIRDFNSCALPFHFVCITARLAAYQTGSFTFFIVGLHLSSVAKSTCATYTSTLYTWLFKFSATYEHANCQ